MKNLNYFMILWTLLSIFIGVGPNALAADENGSTCATVVSGSSPNRQLTIDDVLGSPKVSLGDRRAYGVFTCHSCGQTSMTSAVNGRISCVGCNNPLDTEAAVGIFSGSGRNVQVPEALIKTETSIPAIIATHWQCGSCNTVAQPSHDNCPSCGQNRSERLKTFNPFGRGTLDPEVLKLLDEHGYTLILGKNDHVDPGTLLAQMKAKAERSRTPEERAQQNPNRKSDEKVPSAPPATPVKKRGIPHIAKAILKSRIFQAAAGVSALSMVGAAAVVSYLAAPYDALQGPVVEKTAELIVFENAETYMKYTTPEIRIDESGNAVLAPKNYDPANKTDGVEIFKMGSDGIWITPVGSAEINPNSPMGVVIEKYTVVVDLNLESGNTPFNVSAEDYDKFNVGQELTVTFESALDSQIKPANR